MGQDQLNTRLQTGRGGPKSATRGLWLTAGLGFITVILLLPGTGHTREAADRSKPAAPARPAMPVEAAQVEVMAANREITAVGTLNSNEEVVVAAEISGRVTGIAFTEGHRAKTGQVLVRLDPSILEAQRDRAEASLTLSRANRERSGILFRDKAISEREWDEANAKWRLDEASLRLAQAQLDKTVLRAPFDGVLGLRNVSIGEYVQPGQPIVTLDDTDPIKLDFQVPELYSSGLQVGQTVEVRVDAAPGRSYSGLVYVIDPKVDPRGRSLMVRAKIANRDGALRPGMFAQIRLILEEKPNALMIPEQALLARGESRFVYKVVDGAVEQAVVTIGLRRRGLVEIISGLSAGDTVITAGHMKVRPGSPVTVVPSAEGN